MRRPILTLISIIVLLSAVALSAACAPSTEGDPARTRSRGRPDVSAELKVAFGQRLGSSRVRPSSVIAEVDGDVTDAQLFGILMTAADAHSSEPKIQLIFMPIGGGATYRVVDWHRSSGRLVRMRGEGSAQSMLETPPPGVAAAQAYTAFPDGGIAGGVDETAMKRYAAGEPVPWDDSVK